MKILIYWKIRIWEVRENVEFWVNLEMFLDFLTFQNLASQNFSPFDGGLVECVDFEKFAQKCGRRLEKKEEFAEGFFVDLVEFDRATGFFCLGERFCPSFSS